MAKKKKVIISTLYGWSNYGNRLQNYALTTILRRLGFSVSTPLPSFLIFIKSRLKYTTPFRIMRKKEAKLFDFTRKTIRNDFLFPRNADYIVVGSDQVWNPEYLYENHLPLRPPYLDKPTIAYAASVGVNYLADKDKQMFKHYLSYYSAISVREPEAKEIIQPLTRDSVSVVLDPTLLLDKKDWLEIAKRPSIAPSKKYILCYMLGDSRYDEVINNYASKQDLDIVYFSDRRDSDYGVENFLYLVENASLVCTDSFHACVFSFLFEKPFVAFKRDGNAKMYSRISNLLKTFKIENREYNGTKITPINAVADYKKSLSLLDEKRKQSIRFLADNLEPKQ